MGQVLKVSVGQRAVATQEVTDSVERSFVELTVSRRCGALGPDWCRDKVTRVTAAV